MLSAKKRIDVIFLIISFGLIVVSAILQNYYNLVVGIILGFLCASIIFHKDIKKIEQGKINRMLLNLIINMIIYTVTFVIAIYFFNYSGFFAAAITLLVYRTIVIKLIEKKFINKEQVNE